MKELYVKPLLAVSELSTIDVLTASTPGGTDPDGGGWGELKPIAPNT